VARGFRPTTGRPRSVLLLLRVMVVALLDSVSIP
jgi:hypothetical protein